MSDSRSQAFSLKKIGRSKSLRDMTRSSVKSASASMEDFRNLSRKSKENNSTSELPLHDPTASPKGSPSTTPTASPNPPRKSSVLKKNARRMSMVFKKNSDWSELSFDSSSVPSPINNRRGSVIRSNNSINDNNNDNNDNNKKSTSPKTSIFGKKKKGNPEGKKGSYKLKKRPSLDLGNIAASCGSPRSSRNKPPPSPFSSSSLCSEDTPLVNFPLTPTRKVQTPPRHSPKGGASPPLSPVPSFSSQEVFSALTEGVSALNSLTSSHDGLPPVAPSSDSSSPILAKKRDNLSRSCSFVSDDVKKCEKKPEEAKKEGTSASLDTIKKNPREGESISTSGGNERKKESRRAKQKKKQRAEKLKERRKGSFVKYSKPLDLKNIDSSPSDSAPQSARLYKKKAGSSLDFPHSGDVVTKKGKDSGLKSLTLGRSSFRPQKHSRGVIYFDEPKKKKGSKRSGSERRKNDKGSRGLPDFNLFNNDKQGEKKSDPPSPEVEAVSTDTITHPDSGKKGSKIIVDLKLAAGGLDKHWSDFVSPRGKRRPTQTKGMLSGHNDKTDEKVSPRLKSRSTSFIAAAKPLVNMKRKSTTIEKQKIDTKPFKDISSQEIANMSIEELQSTITLTLDNLLSVLPSLSSSQSSLLKTGLQECHKELESSMPAELLTAIKV